MSLQKTFSSYVNTLHHLTLDNCNLSDVSMLGTIPHLELLYCEGIEDISALNNNDQIAVIECTGVIDYSHSFTNSRKITVVVAETRNGPSCIFDLSQWLKVEELTLQSSNDLVIDNYQLPKTVKKCRLEGSFVAAVDFTLTTDHVLQELTLSDDDTIRSLKKYRLKRVPVITCIDLQGLKSLVGLGRGKNRKISLIECHKIKNFSKLNRVPIVQIFSCAGFHDLSQLAFVQDLRIRGHYSVMFRTELLTNNGNPYKHLQSLTISGVNHVKCLNGLVKIPFLGLHFEDWTWIRRLLKEGNPFENQKIVIIGGSISDSSIQEVIEYHERYMKNRYDSVNRLPTKWIWVRKEQEADTSYISQL